jgi:hypothetical protein
LKRIACFVVSGGPAFRADRAPSLDADKYLKECHGYRQANPAQARKIDARRQVGKIRLAEREIKQRRRDHYLCCRKQDSAHLARARQVGEAS